MAEKDYSLDFQGYWLERNGRDVPAASGVYCVYACTYSGTTDKVSLRLLIYIGESGDVRGRILNHEKLSDWRAHLRGGEELCFSFASVGSTDRERVEAALIFHHKPVENIEFKNSFPFDTTNITTSGLNALLAQSFSVRHTP